MYNSEWSDTYHTDLRFFGLFTNDSLICMYNVQRKLISKCNAFKSNHSCSHTYIIWINNSDIVPYHSDAMPWHAMPCLAIPVSLLVYPLSFCSFSKSFMLLLSFDHEWCIFKSSTLLDLHVGNFFFGSLWKYLIQRKPIIVSSAKLC